MQLFLQLLNKDLEFLEMLSIPKKMITTKPAKCYKRTLTAYPLPFRILCGTCRVWNDSSSSSVLLAPKNGQFQQNIPTEVLKYLCLTFSLVVKRVEHDFKLNKLNKHPTYMFQGTLVAWDLKQDNEIVAQTTYKRTRRFSMLQTSPCYLP